MKLSAKMGSFMEALKVPAFASKLSSLHLQGFQ